MRSVFGNGLFDVVVVLILNFWVVATVVVPNNQRMIMGLPMGLKLEHPTAISSRDTVMESVNCYSKMTK